MASCFIAHASDTLPRAAKPTASDSKGEKAKSSLDALKKANKYSFETGGIGVLIAYGTGNSVSAEYVGDAFVSEIERRGSNARYFFYEPEWGGMTVEYHIGYSALGPWNADEAAGKISKAVERAKAARNIHNQASSQN